jgi:predicted RNA-binding protein with PIN domain
MAYIVDGNNVMGQRPGWHRDRAAARRNLLEELSAFALARQARITAVFDGEPGRDFPEGSAHKGVKVLYALPGSDADHRIEQLVASSRDPRGLTVVTSDRRLAFTLRSLGARVMRSGEFRRLIEDASARVSSRESDQKIDPENMDDWLDYFGVSDDQ